MTTETLAACCDTCYWLNHKRLGRPACKTSFKKSVDKEADKKEAFGICSVYQPKP